MKTAKTRKESFFGIHSDFHANPKDGHIIGATLKEEDVRTLCETLKPDYFQIDCKGHPGWTSYPTKLGNAMPQIQQDIIAMWRRVTREYGIALYLHYSGIYEIKYCGEHPDQCVMNAQGELTDYARMDGTFADDLLIPQISELVENYDIDGVWIDGDCWATQLDYHPETIAKFEVRTGIDLQGNPPVKDGDPYYGEYVEFHRELFREYLKYYVDALHKKYPQLEICSNWAFSHFMPEALCADVDFLSGDLTPSDCVNSARHCGRMFARHDIPWDLMSWGFRIGVYETFLFAYKHITQILQESAATISLGGGYQVDIAQFPDGSHNINHLLQLAPLAEFMRKREAFCAHGRPIPQVGVMVSTADRYADLKLPFSNGSRDRLFGITSLLCDCGISTEMLCDHNLDKLDRYPLLVIPELGIEPAPELVSQWKAYAENGGSLLIVGTKTAQYLAPHFGFIANNFIASDKENIFEAMNNGHDQTTITNDAPCFFSVNGKDFGVSKGAYTIDAGQQAREFGRVYETFRDAGKPFAQIFPFGKGQVGVIGIDLGSQYNIGMQHHHRVLTRAMADALYTPLAWVDSAKGMLELTCLEKDGKFMLQLVNANGCHHHQKSITEDYIPAIYDARLSIAADKPIKKLILQPEGKEIPFVLEDGRYRFTVDCIEIHSVVEVQYE